LRVQTAATAVARRFSDARTYAGSRKTLGQAVLEKDDEYCLFFIKDDGFKFKIARSVACATRFRGCCLRSHLVMARPSFDEAQRHAETGLFQDG
jgi:hypothetical protein